MQDSLHVPSLPTAKLSTYFNKNTWLWPQSIQSYRNLHQQLNTSEPKESAIITSGPFTICPIKNSKQFPYQLRWNPGRQRCAANLWIWVSSHAIIISIGTSQALKTHCKNSEPVHGVLGNLSFRKTYCFTQLFIIIIIIIIINVSIIVAIVWLWTGEFITFVHIIKICTSAHCQWLHLYPG